MIVGISLRKVSATAFTSAFALAGVSALAEIEKTCDCCWVPTEILLASSFAETE